jgi:hypothetical protein
MDQCQSQQLQQQWDIQRHDDLQEAVLGRLQSTSDWSPYDISASSSHTFSSDLVTHKAPSGMPGSWTVSRHCPFTPNYVTNLEPPAADSFTGVKTSTRLLTIPQLNTSLPLYWFNPYCRPDHDVQDHNRIITSPDAVQASCNSTPLNLDMAGPMTWSELTRQITPPTKNGHAPPPIKS